MTFDDGGEVRAARSAADLLLSMMGPGLGTAGRGLGMLVGGGLGSAWTAAGSLVPDPISNLPLLVCRLTVGGVLAVRLTCR